MLWQVSDTSTASHAPSLQLPSWPATYSLSSSTMTFPDGNHSGYANASRVELDAKYGLITYGWELRVCLTAQPSGPRAACSNAAAEHSMDEQARQVKAINRHTRVFHYRNTMLGLSSFDDQCTKMYDPNCAGHWLTSGDRAGGSPINTPADPRSLEPCLPRVLPPDCRLPWGCKGLQQDQYYRDFSNASAADYFVETVIGRAANSSNADGVWMDDIDGCCAPFGDARHGAQVFKGFSEKRLHAISAATNDTVLRAERLLHERGKWSFNSPNGFLRLPAPTNVTSQCVSALEAGAAMANRATVMYVGYSVPPKPPQPTTALDFRQLLAAFLLVRGDYSWFGHGWITSKSPVWYPEWDWDVGVPLGNMSRNGTVFVRHWSKGMVSLSCDSFQASFSFTAAAALKTDDQQHMAPSSMPTKASAPAPVTAVTALKHDDDEVAPAILRVNTSTLAPVRVTDCGKISGRAEPCALLATLYTHAPLVSHGLTTPCHVLALTCEPAAGVRSFLIPPV